MKSEKNRILIVTTVSGFVPQFEMNHVRLLQSMGYEVHYAANYNTPVYTDNNTRLKNTGIITHQIDFVRSPYSLKNIKAYRQLKKVMRDNSFLMVHCHTPVGGVLARIAANSTQVPHVIYTAHGFHFYKGAPWRNWLCFYPIEKSLATYTDTLITINREDYNQAKYFKLRHQGKVEFVPGVGIDTYKSLPTPQYHLKNELGITREQIVFTSVGELTKRKNHEVVIRAMAEVRKHNLPVVYLICGSGCLQEKLIKLVKKLGLEENVKLLGYRTDIEDILRITDCFVCPSKQEGLPVAVLEAMNAELPVICSNIRGNIDLIDDGLGGYVIPNNTKMEYVEKMLLIIEREDHGKSFGQYNKKRVRNYDQSIVSSRMKEIYCRLLNRYFDESV